eukprot:scaffold1675_cov146-Skeletonema_menzelii.AAC.9
MTISTTQPNQKPFCVKKSTPAKKSRGPKDAVPFEEMERLMNLYGSTKAPRIRGAPKKEGSVEGSAKKGVVKKDSIKRKFYRWFPNFEERFAKDKDGHYQPINGHANEMKYRQEMRAKSMKIVTAKRSDSIFKKKYEKNKKIGEGVTTTEGNVISRQVSNSNNGDINNTSDIKIPDDIQIDIVVPSPTGTPSGNSKKSLFLDNGYRAPSPLSFQQQPTEKRVSENNDTILSFVSQDSEEENLMQNLFDEADKQFYGIGAMSRMQSCDPMPMMQSYGAMPTMNSYDPMPMMNPYDQIQMSELSMSSMLNLYPSMPMNSECFSDRFSDDSVQGSMGMVSHGSSSSGNSSLNLDEQWGSDIDIEDCLLLGMNGQ